MADSYKAVIVGKIQMKLDIRSNLQSVLHDIFKYDLSSQNLITFIFSLIMSMIYNFS